MGTPIQSDRNRVAKRGWIAGCLFLATLIGCSQSTQDLAKEVPLFPVSVDLLAITEKAEGDLGYFVRFVKPPGEKELFLYFSDAIIVIDEEGTVTTYEMPEGRFAWLGEDHEFVAWWPSVEKLVFRDGTELDLPRGDVTTRTGHVNRDVPYGIFFSPSGKYFCLSPPGPQETHIYSTANPTELLATMPIYGDEIFEGTSEIYVIGVDPFSKRDTLRLFIFGTDGGELKQRRNIAIERPWPGRRSPFYVIDVDVDKGLIAIVDSRDPPAVILFPTKIYVFDVESETLLKFGKEAGHRYMFLEGDGYSNLVRKINR